MEKTAAGLVAYAKAQLGRPYWYGSFGQAASRELYEQKKRQYPSRYEWEYDGETAKVHDCAGLVKGYLWSRDPEDKNPVYDPSQDISANQMHTACKTKGEIATMPEVPGTLVFYPGHLGVYIGSGEVIEARGRRYGVVKTRLESRPWKTWGYCPYITYEAAKILQLGLPVLKKGAKGETVRAFQLLLLGYGQNFGSYR